MPGRRRISTPRPPLFGRAAWTGVVAGMICLSPGVSAQTEPPPRDPTLIETLTDSELADANRAGAARALVNDASTPSGLAAFDRVLKSDPADDASRAILLRAVAGAEAPPATLWPIVRDLALERSPIRADAIRACAAFRTRASARVLVGLLNSDSYRDAAGALVALTGRDEYGSDTAKWREWLIRVEALDDNGWRDELVAALGARVTRATRRNDELRADASAAYRRLYLATPDTGRAALLAEMLEHRQGVVRTLAFDLALREISAGADLSGPVVDAAKRMVVSPDAQTRANGAVLITRLAPPDAQALITGAISTETDPVAAIPLLGACARWPSAEVLEPVLAWLDTESAWPAASEAAWVLHNAKLLDAPGDRDRVLSAVHARTLATLGPAGLRLLVTLGDETDLHTVAGLLNNDRNKSAAAEALTLRPGGVPVLLTAVQLDGTLFTHACRAVALHDPTPLNFRVLQAATPADEAQRVPNLLEVGRAMSSQALLDLTERLPSDDPMCESLLVLLADPERAETAPAARMQGLVRLAEIRVDSARAESALAVLPARELFDPQADIAGRIDRVTLIANLLLGDTAGAFVVQAPPSVWLDALSRVTNPAVLLSALAHVETVHGPVLTATERASLDTLRVRAQRAVDNPDAGIAEVEGDDPSS